MLIKVLLNLLVLYKGVVKIFGLCRVIEGWLVLNGNKWNNWLLGLEMVCWKKFWYNLDFFCDKLLIFVVLRVLMYDIL